MRIITRIAGTVVRRRENKVIALERPRHPIKEIEAAVRFAEGRGWTVIRASGHSWALLRCPLGNRIGHVVPVFSTPKGAESGAKKIRNRVSACEHGTGEN